MSLPSPLYTLLSTNDWGHRHDNGLHTITAGLAMGGWEFDANETHNGVSLLRVLLQGWSTHQGTPADLLKLASHLLDRGADPASAFESQPGRASHITWSDHAALVSLLKSRISPSPAEDNVALGVSLLSLVSQQGKSQEIAKLVQKALEKHEGVGTRIQGIRAVPWLCLHAAFVRGSTELLGWGRPYTSQAESNVLQMRVFKKLVSDDKSQYEWTPLERWCVASAAWARVDSMGGTAGEQDLSNQLQSLSKKLSLGLDVEAVFADNVPALSESLRLRLVASTLASHSQLVWERGWNAVRAALPLAFEGHTNVLGDELLGRVLPTYLPAGKSLDAMWQGWDFDRHASYTQALEVWLSSWREIGPATALNAMRSQWLDGLVKAIDSHPQALQEAASKPLIERLGKLADAHPELVDALRAHRAQLEAFALEQSWTTCQPSPSRPRM